MKIPSNKIKDIRRYMNGVLKDIYPDKEIDSFLEILLFSYANIDRNTFYSTPDKTVTESVLLKINNAIKSLKKGMPVQYIVGYTEFLDISLNVNPAVLIPRPETEELTLLALKHLSQFSHNEKPVVLDAGTGSGAIALSIKKKWPQAEVFAFDNAFEALKMASDNAAKNKLCVHFFNTDFNDFYPPENMPPLDLIISNPPYVRLSEKAVMKSNVLNYEPHSALFVNDDDPLYFYKLLIQIANKHLKSNGFLCCEINEALGKEMHQLFAEEPYKDFAILKDIHDKDRFVKAVKN